MESMLRSSQPADIVSVCEQLTSETLELLLQAQREMHDGVPSYPDRMNGYYEEAKGIFDKIVTACENNDYDTAYYNAIRIQDETARFLHYAETGQWPSRLTPGLSYMSAYERAGLPELGVHLDARDLEPLREAAERLSIRLEDYLRTKGVAIRRFADIASFSAYLDAARGRSPS